MASEVRAVLEANERFYRALNALDLGEMDRLWAHGSFVRCVHPGWELIVGWESVRASWEGIFRNSAGGPAHSVEAADVTVHLLSDLGWVSCIERITLQGLQGLQGLPARSTGSARSARIESSTSLAVATNLFQRSSDDGTRWEMILHHASLLPLVVAESMGSPEVVH